MRIFRKEIFGLLLSAVAGSALSLSLLGSPAFAQNDRLVEDPRHARAGQEAQKTFECDHPTLTVVRTDNVPLTFANAGFLNLQGSSIAFETFGDRCVKVLFTAKAATTANCLVRALLNGFVMDPSSGSSGQSLVSNDDTFDAHGYAWAGKISGGDHTVVIQYRVIGGSCTIDDWTVDLEVWND